MFHVHLYFEKMKSSLLPDSDRAKWTYEIPCHVTRIVDGYHGSFQFGSLLTCWYCWPGNKHFWHQRNFWVVGCLQFTYTCVTFWLALTTSFHYLCIHSIPLCHVLMFEPGSTQNLFRYIPPINKEKWHVDTQNDAMFFCRLNTMFPGPALLLSLPWSFVGCILLSNT